MTSWRNRKTLILSRTDMMGLLEPGEYVDCVETAFRRHGEGRCYLEPKGHIVLDKYPGEWEVMPSYIEEPAGADVTEAAACKWVSIREHNRAKFDLPTVFSILVYTEPETGFPLAIVDGSYHTMMRTGASAAVSIRWLARKDASVLALVGAGDVGIGSLRTCATIRDWSEVRVWSRTQATLDNFMESEAPRHPGLNLVPSTDLEAVVRGADAVVTTTTGADPVVKDAWVADGTHIAALGSDLAGTSPAIRSWPSRGERASSWTTSGSACPTARSTCRSRRASSRPTMWPARSAPSSAAGSRAAATTPRSRSSIRPGSRSRIRRPSRSNISAPSRPASASRRR